MTTNREKIRELIAKAKSQKEGKAFVQLFKIESDLATKIFSKCGIDLLGYTVVMEADAIRHTIRAHGNELKEKNRGQIAITEVDFLCVPQIILEADIIEVADTNKKGLEVIRFIKQFEGEYYVLEEVRKGRKHLALNTMFIKKPPVFKTEGLP